MGQITTAGKILLRQNVSPEYHQFMLDKELDKKGIGKLFADLAEKQPEKYKDIVSGLTRLGFEVSTRLGSTVTLEDLLPPAFKDEAVKGLNKQLAEIKDKKLSKDKQQEELNATYGKFADSIDKELVEVGVKENRILAKIVKAGARGSATQYRQTIFGPIIVQDAKGGMLTDFPVMHSFAEGLSLPEYLAHTFGSRAGSVSTKLAVADSGYLSKQMSRATMTTIVEEHDCGTHNGIEISVDDKDYIGCFLAHPVDGFNYNNELTPKVVAALKEEGVKKLVIRNVITCQSPGHFHPGAVCQLCVGRREKGLPAIGEYVALTAGTGLGESLSQGSLSAKHSSGAAKHKIKASGFKFINSLFNIPETFPHRAPLASKDGKVVDIRPAAQGGFYVEIKDNDGKTEEHYINPDLEILVKKGDEVEAGDVLSEGIANPAEIVKHKGIGEGRRYFSDILKEAFDNSGLGGINKRNFDLIARSGVNHVKITNPKGLGDYLPDQIATYHAVEKGYIPRTDSKKVRTDAAKGLFLEVPELHYTIGTRLTSKMIESLKNHKIDYVTVNDSPPDFEPEMQRLLDVPAHEQDWMHQLYSTNLERRLLKMVNTGASSDIHGPSPVPGLAYAVGFGQKKQADEEVKLVEEPFSFE